VYIFPKVFDVGVTDVVCTDLVDRGSPIAAFCACSWLISCGSIFAAYMGFEFKNPVKAPFAAAALAASWIAAMLELAGLKSAACALPTKPNPSLLLGAAFASSPALTEFRAALS
jgi:hypothetical protein